MRITEDQAFEVCDVVETDYSGKVTKHIIAARFKVRNSQTGVVYEVVPTVPKSKEGDRTPRIDHAWFRRIGRLRMVGQKILYEEIESAPGGSRQ